MPDYELEIDGRRYQLTSEKPIKPADAQRFIERFKAEHAARSGRGTQAPPAATPTDGRIAGAPIRPKGLKRPGPQAAPAGPQSLQEQAAAIIRRNQQANRANRSEFKGKDNPLDLSSAISTFTQPISHLMSMGGRFLAEHTPTVTSFGAGVPSVGGSTPPQPPSPLQQEIERQQARLPFSDRLDAEDPGGFLRGVNPDFTREVEKPSSGYAEAGVKSLVKGGMELATLDNAVIARLLGPIQGAEKLSKVIHLAVTGYFGNEVRKSVIDDWGRYKASGYKDKDALADSLTHGAFGAALASHATKEITGKTPIGLGNAAAEKWKAKRAAQTPAAPEATAPVQGSQAAGLKRSIDPNRDPRKPLPKPKPDAGAKRARALDGLNLRKADQERIAAAAQAAAAPKPRAARAAEKAQPAPEPAKTRTTAPKSQGQAPARPAVQSAEKGKLPETPTTTKDQATLEKGPQEMHSGINPFKILRDVKDSPGGQKVRDFFTGDKPALGTTSKAGLHSVNQHEHARITAHLESDRVVPEVTAHLSPADRAAFLTYGVADRMAGLKEKLRGTIASSTTKQAALAKQELVLQREAAAAFKAHDEPTYKAKSAAVEKVAEQRRSLMREAAAAKQQIAAVALDRKVNPLTVTMPDGSSHRVTEANIKAFFSRPEIKQALDAHRANVEPLLHRNQQLQGNAAGVSLGKHTGAYFPAEALDNQGAARIGSSSKGGRHQPTATLARNTHAKEFTGAGHSYAGDYDEVTRRDLAAGYTRGTERQMHERLIEEGIEHIDVPGNKSIRRVDGRLEVNVKGKWEPGYDFTIQRGVKAGKAGIVGTTDENLPTKVVMPTRIYNEMRPLFDREFQSAADSLASNWFGRYLQVYLLKPADMVQHGAALGSRATYGALRAPMSGIERTAKASVATAQSVANFIRFFNANLYPETTRYQALKFASETGVLPKGFGDMSKTGALSALTQAGHNKLYGRRGILANAVTSVYNEFAKRGALKTPEGREMLRDALRDTFNTHGATDQAQLAEGLQRIGLGTFYQTGVKNRTAALSAGAHAYAASIAGRVLLNIALVSALDDRHRMPWQIKGYRYGMIPIWKDKDGRTLYVDGRIMDRAGYYPDSLMLSVAGLAEAGTEGAAGKKGAERKALQSSSDLINWMTAPAVSGPVPQIVSGIAGPIPHVYPNRDLSGIEMGRSPLTKLGYTPKRALGIATQAIPFAGLAYDPAAEASASQPKSEAARLANKILPLLGLPLIRAGQDEQVILLNEERQDAAQERTEAKAEGRRPARSSLPSVLRPRSSRSPLGIGR